MMGNSPQYKQYTVNEFKENFNCPSCQKEGPSNAKLITSTNDIIFVCSHCHKSTIVFSPPKEKKETVPASKCASCNCIDYQPVVGITCKCGHLGSYHISYRREVSSSWSDPYINQQYLK
jgi:transcription elongation factor Elf1